MRYLLGLCCAFATILAAWTLASCFRCKLQDCENCASHASDLQERRSRARRAFVKTDRLSLPFLLRPKRCAIGLSSRPGMISGQALLTVFTLWLTLHRLNFLSRVRPSDDSRRADAGRPRRERRRTSPALHKSITHFFARKMDAGLMLNSLTPMATKVGIRSGRAAASPQTPTGSPAWRAASQIIATAFKTAG